MKISVVTPTIRKDGLSMVHQALKNQTVEYEWLIGSSFDPEIPDAKWVVDDFQGGFWTLNRMLTKLCRKAQGDLLVFLQDYIWVPPTGLEKFLINWEATNAAISGIGDQYAKVDEYGKPYVRIWEDPRKTDKFGSFYECQPNDWETNWACIGKKELERVNYFVDEADMLGYGYDNVLVAEKLDQIGIKFYLDQTNKSYTLRHGRERKDWEENYIMKNGGLDKLVKKVL